MSSRIDQGNIPVAQVLLTVSSPARVVANFYEFLRSVDVGRD